MAPKFFQKWPQDFSKNGPKIFPKRPIFGPESGPFLDQNPAHFWTRIRASFGTRIRPIFGPESEPKGQKRRQKSQAKPEQSEARANEELILSQVFRKKKKHFLNKCPENLDHGPWSRPWSSTMVQAFIVSCFMFLDHGRLSNKKLIHHFAFLLKRKI